MNRCVFLTIRSTSGDMELSAHGADRVDNIVLFTAIVVDGANVFACGYRL